MKFCPVCGREYDDGEVCEADGTVLIEPQPSQAELLVGRVLKGSYRMDEKIGEGGMGTVFRGEQIALNRDVAIKVMLPGLQSTPSMIQRFYREARLLSQLNHPHVVGIIDFGHTSDGIVFMVMELLLGLPLDEVLLEGPLAAPRLLALMRQTCDGVAAAHRRGLVHRDLKPENVFVGSASQGEQVKLLDFGIARAMEVEGQTRLTHAGQMVGTPGFLAPEQIQGEDADQRSDVYALGAILYFMATGRRPYAGATPQAIFARQLHETLDFDPAALGDKMPLSGIMERAMRVDPDERYQTADELIEALEIRALESGLVEPDPRTTPAHLSKPTGVAPTRLLDAGSPVGAAGSKQQSGRRWIAPLGVFALLAVGLLWLRPWQDRSDGSQAGETVETAETVETVRGVTDDSVTVGMSAAFSGPSRELGRAMQLGIQTCFRDVEARGGVHGRLLELVALDDGYEPSRTVANMAQLALQRRVFAVLGNVGTPTAEVAVPFAVDQDLPFFGAFSGADLLRKSPPDRWVFNYRASYFEETAALVEHFLDARGVQPSEIAVFAQQDSFGDSGYRGVEATLAARGHEASVLRLGYRRNTNDVSDAVEHLLRHETEIKAVVLVATYRTAAEFVRRVEDATRDEARDLLFGALSFVGSRAFADELKELRGDYADGVIVSQVVPHFASDLPGVQRYRELLAEYFPAEQPGFVSLEGYLAARTFVEGVQRAGRDLTPDRFVEAMESLDALDLGIGETLRFGSDRHQGSDAVWGTELNASGEYRDLPLRIP